MAAEMTADWPYALFPFQSVLDRCAGETGRLCDAVNVLQNGLDEAAEEIVRDKSMSNDFPIAVDVSIAADGSHEFLVTPPNSVDGYGNIKLAPNAWGVATELVKQELVRNNEVHGGAIFAVFAANQQTLDALNMLHRRELQPIVIGIARSIANPSPSGEPRTVYMPLIVPKTGTACSAVPLHGGATNNLEPATASWFADPPIDGNALRPFWLVDESKEPEETAVAIEETVVEDEDDFQPRKPRSRLRPAVVESDEEEELEEEVEVQETVSEQVSNNPFGALGALAAAEPVKTLPSGKKPSVDDEDVPLGELAAARESRKRRSPESAGAGGAGAGAGAGAGGGGSSGRSKKKASSQTKYAVAAEFIASFQQSGGADTFPAGVPTLDDSTDRLRLVLNKGGITKSNTLAANPVVALGELVKHYSTLKVTASPEDARYFDSLIQFYVAMADTNIGETLAMGLLVSKPEDQRRIMDAVAAAFTTTNNVLQQTLNRAKALQTVVTLNDAQRTQMLSSPLPTFGTYEETLNGYAAINISALPPAVLAIVAGMPFSVGVIASEQNGSRMGVVDLFRYVSAADNIRDLSDVWVHTYRIQFQHGAFHDIKDVMKTVFEIPKGASGAKEYFKK